MIKGIKIAISSFIACTIILSSANVANASEAEFVNHPHSISNTQTLQEEELQRGDRKSTRLNSSHSGESRMPSSA